MPPITTLQGVMSSILQMGKLRRGSHSRVRTGTEAGRDQSGSLKGTRTGQTDPSRGAALGQSLRSLGRGSEEGTAFSLNPGQSTDS